MLASDDLNTQFTGAHNPDRVLHVTFFMRSVQDNFQTLKQGCPVFKDEEWVRILIPGRNDLTVEEPVEEHHKMRFPQQWAMFKNMTATVDQVVGTPVTEWPLLTRAQAEELKAKKFYTVQQIAECSDAQIQALGMNANNLRQKARAFLASAQTSAAALAQSEELARKDQEIAELRAGQERLSQQLVQFMASQEKKRKPMSEEARKAAGERLAAARAAKAAKAAV